MGRHILRTLLSNASAAGSAASWEGGRGAFMVEGTLGGATVSLQYRTPNLTWVDVAAGLTAAGMQVFECPPGDVRANVASGTPSALYAYAITTDSL